MSGLTAENDETRINHSHPYTALVTVVIPTFNSGEYLKEAVESVLHQTFTNWKLIIIDDASTDNSLDTISEYLNDSRILLIERPKNVGQTECLNIALQHVTTPYMLQLDSDDWFYPYTIEVLMKETDNTDNDTALISGNIKLVWQDESGEIVNSTVRYGRNFSDPYEFMRAGQSCWPRLYRTDAVRSVGGWPVDGPYGGRYIEDLRILYRLIPHYRFHWINETLYIHRRHQHNMTRRVKQNRETIFWLIRDTLKKWGDHYTPKFKLTKYGYPRLTALVPKHNKPRKLKSIPGKKVEQRTLNKKRKIQQTANHSHTRVVFTPVKSVKGLSLNCTQGPSRMPVKNSWHQNHKRSTNKEPRVVKNSTRYTKLVKRIIKKRST